MTGADFHQKLCGGKKLMESIDTRAIYPERWAGAWVLWKIRLPISRRFIVLLPTPANLDQGPKLWDLSEEYDEKFTQTNPLYFCSIL